MNAEESVKHTQTDKNKSNFLVDSFGDVDKDFGRLRASMFYVKIDSLVVVSCFTILQRNYSLENHFLSFFQNLAGECTEEYLEYNYCTT